MELHRFQQILHHVLLAALAALPMTSAAIITQTIPAMPSPSSYRIASSTLPSKQGGVACIGHHIPPTPVPELRRRQQSLGWTDPSTCNVGVCDPGQYCTVFGSEGITDSLVTGICCGTGIICSSLTTCIDQTAHSMGTISLGVYSGGTVFCGTKFPYCSSRFFQYGYGLGTFLELDCWATRQPGALSTTILNPSWKLYAVNTKPEKGPPPTTTYGSDVLSSITSTTSSSSTSSTAETIIIVTPSIIPSEEKPKAMPVGAIAGIVIGCICVVAVCVVAVILVWSKLRRNDLPLQEPPMGHDQLQPLHTVADRSEHYEPPKDTEPGYTSPHHRRWSEHNYGGHRIERMPVFADPVELGGSRVEREIEGRGVNMLQSREMPDPPQGQGFEGMRQSWGVEDSHRGLG